LLLLVFSFMAPPKIRAQCCSGGSPTGVGAYAGMLPEKTLRISTFVRYMRSQDYYSKDVRLDNPIVVLKSDFIYQGLSISYGITRSWALELDMGYYYLKDQTYINNYYLSSRGLSNGSLSVKRMLYHSDSRGWDLSAGLGVKFPFRLEPMYKDNVRLPVDLQPSSQAFGINALFFLKKKLIPYRLSVYWVNRYEHNFRNRDLYRFGNKLRSSVMLEAYWTRALSSIFQLRFDYTAYDYDFRRDERYPHSGSAILFLSPSVSFQAGKFWSLALAGELPLYRYYKGSQLSSKYSFALSLTKDLNINRK
jgi:hypothetical protein